MHMQYIHNNHTSILNHPPLQKSRCLDGNKPLPPPPFQKFGRHFALHGPQQPTSVPGAGPLTATLGLELGPVKKLTANVKSKWTYSQKRFLELGAFWSERMNAQTFQVTAQPHANLKLQNT
jgi:hypothetical protein